MCNQHEEIEEKEHKIDQLEKQLSEANNLFSGADMVAQEYVLKNIKLEKLIERIQGMCGTPDAAEGCRNILKAIRGSK